MLIRTVSLAAGVIGAIAGAQLPEIMQQYQQRLGGATDEIAAVVGRFDSDAAVNNLSRSDALSHLRESEEDLVRRRGIDMELNIERLSILREQREYLKGDYPTRAVHFLWSADGTLLQDTLADYKPAVPTTVEGAISAFIGFVAGWSIIRLIAWPFRRWREMRVRGVLRRN
jgi:hypothetical protein